MQAQDADALFREMKDVAEANKLVEAIYELGNAKNSKKYADFLKGYKDEIKLLYHICFGEK